MAEKTANKMVVSLPSDTEIALTRDFDAPQKLVYEVFTKEEHIKNWYAPSFVEVVSLQNDSRVGGTYRYVIRGQEGTEVSFTGETLEMVPFSKVVYTEIFHMPGFDSAPSHVTTTFTAMGDKKTRVVTNTVYDSKETRDSVVASGMESGAALSYDQAEAIVLKLLVSGAGPAFAKDLVIERTFDAPRAAVWKAWSDAAAITKWWGPANMTSPVCHMDFRVGGSFHACMKSAEGQEFWSMGFYREISPIERIVYVDTFADAKGNVVPATYYGFAEDFPLETVVRVELLDLGGKTKMKLTHSGMPHGEMFEGTAAGWNEMFDKLSVNL